MVKIGDKFGRWTVTGVAPRKGHNKRWSVKCDCGNVGSVFHFSLENGASKSCGCFQREISRSICISRTIHGDACRGKMTRLRSIWGDIRKRCTNPRTKSFVNYGGRGIKICDAWADYRMFKEWALAHGYRDTLTIDRINNNGNYEPGNCRWATVGEQSLNKRTTKLLSYKGETKSVQEWAASIGIGYKILWARLKRWGSVEKCLVTPLRA